MRLRVARGSAAFLLLTSPSSSLLPIALRRRGSGSSSCGGMASSSSFSGLFDTPIVLRKVEDILSRYEIFLLDQFGAIHNGVSPIPGAVEAVRMLVANGKPVIICSNTSQRKEYASRRFEQMGFPTTGVEFCTSGEACWQHLSSPAFPHKKAFVFGWRDTTLTSNFMSGLNIIQVDSVEEADCLLFQGPDTMGSQSAPTLLSLTTTGIIDDCADVVLRKAASLNLPAYCANLDLCARMANDDLRYMPGILKQHYEKLGGNVIGFGKPNAEYFDEALEIGVQRLQEQEQTKGSELTIELVRNGDGARNLPRQGVRKVRGIHVGDSLEHDIDGASNARIDSLLITDHGIHRDEFVLDEAGEGNSYVDFRADALSPDTSAGPAPPSLIRRVTNFCEKNHHAVPTYILKSFA